MQPTSRFVNVGGAVRNPMRVPFTEDMTLLAAINGAGGFNDFADQKHVRLLRGNTAKMFDVRDQDFASGRADELNRGFDLRSH